MSDNFLSKKIFDKATAPLAIIYVVVLLSIIFGIICFG
ncbi:MAG: hypothetical protein RL110_1723 [Bacteroidota bacterium]